MSPMAMPAFFSTFSVTGDRAGEHDRRLRADIGESPDARPRLQPGARARLLAADQHGGGAIDDAGGIAGVCTWLIASISG